MNYGTSHINTILDGFDMRSTIAKGKSEQGLRFEAILKILLVVFCLFFLCQSLHEFWYFRYQNH